MKINNDSIKKSDLSINTTKSRASKDVEQAGAGKAAADSVTLSSGAQALAGSQAASGTFDAKKVEEIKAAIASGQFRVNPERVADGLIDTVKELISTRKGS